MGRTRQKKSKKKPVASPLRRVWGKLLRLVKGTAATLGSLLATYYGLCVLGLALYNVIWPPTTGVHMQRRVEAWIAGDSYTKRYDPVVREAISLHLAHAAVAAEDGRFYQHRGVDWDAIRLALSDNLKRGRSWRGGSTITQQLVKNLFLTTHSTYFRKALELPLAYVAEWLLPKERILTLYLNVIEWGPGIYGAEAGAQYHYQKSAKQLTRPEAAALAACIPNPRQRTPQKMPQYARTILRRMTQMGY